jgi:hypothetical protein
VGHEMLGSGPIAKEFCVLVKCVCCRNVKPFIDLRDSGVLVVIQASCHKDV